VNARAPLAWLLLLMACTRREPAHQVEGPAARADVSVPDGTERPTPAPLALALSVERTPQGVGLHVANTSQERVELASPVLVAGALALSLRLDCAHQGCVTLEPGSELLAPPWLGQIEGERCDALYRPQQAGDYEFVVKACRGGAEARVRFRWDDR
jgi:hypothetical protein